MNKRRWLSWLACGLVVALSGGCKKDAWVAGKWLLVDEDGKPGACHEFQKEGKKFLVYPGIECEGSPDPLLSGKFQLKEETKLAVLRGNEEVANLAVITERTDERFVTRGAIAGEMYRVGDKGAKALLEQLTQKGVIKIRELPPAQGCKQLSRALKEIQALPKEPNPRMIRRRDQGLEYHVDSSTGDPKIKKVVYGLNQEVIEWVAFHLAEAAYQPPGPVGRLEQTLGKPTHQVASGSGDKRQHIVMYRTYCGDLRGAKNKEIDLTLFSTAGQKRGTIYVSEKVISSMWEELRRAVEDSASQAAAEGEGEGEGEGDAPSETPTPPDKPAKPAPAPAPGPAPAAKPEPKPEPVDDDEI